MFPRGVVGERDQPGLEAWLVAVGRVHVAELVVRRNGAPARAHGDERAVVARLPRRELVEVAERLRAVLLVPAVDVARGLERLAGEPRAREQRPVVANRVGVL